MLILYYRPTCPYCHRVQDAATKLGITFELRDIGKEENRQALIARGGKQQVPYLIDSEREVEMYESKDIILYLETYYKTATS